MLVMHNASGPSGSLHCSVAVAVATAAALCRAKVPRLAWLLTSPPLPHDCLCRQTMSAPYVAKSCLVVVVHLIGAAEGAAILCMHHALPNGPRTVRRKRLHARIADANGSGAAMLQ